MQVRRELGVIVLAIRRAGGEMVFNPAADLKIAAGRSSDRNGRSGSFAETGAGPGGDYYMTVLTAQQMREADRRTIELGTPGDVLMERAGARVVEFLEREFAPLARQRVVIFCGTGNNAATAGGGPAAQESCGCLQVVRATDTPGAVDRDATIVVDALLGTGAREPLESRYVDLVRSINHDFGRAKVVAVDIPSGMQVRADFTVTFAAPKAEMLLNPSAENAAP